MCVVADYMIIMCLIFIIVHKSLQSRDIIRWSHLIIIIQYGSNKSRIFSSHLRPRQQRPKLNSLPAYPWKSKSLSNFHPVR